MGMRETQLLPARYEGPTYYGQPMLKASSYGALVWGYTWIAGLAGSAQVLATIADVLGRPGLRGMVRQGRRLAAFLPVVGAGLLVADLHTPKRFYNMLRIAKRTSPMSIGTWILMGYSAFAGLSTAAQFVADRVPGLSWLRRGARLASVPAAVAIPVPLFSATTARLTSVKRFWSTRSPGRKSVSPGSDTATRRVICRTISSMCLSWIDTPWSR